jgi:hypothetical protein
MNKIAIAAAAIGGFLLIGGGSAGVATAAGPIGIHSTADAPSLVIDVRRGGGRGFHRGGAWRGRGVGWRGRGVGYRRGWRRGWVWRNGIWVAPGVAYGAYGGVCVRARRVCASRWGWGGPNFRHCVVNRGC